MKNTFADSVRAFPYISQPFSFSQRHFFCNDNRFYNTIHIDFFMESADVRYLRTSLFSQNERARLCERVSFEKTNECVNIVQKHFP